VTPKPTKYLDWFWLMVVNFMWATQAPVIKLIGNRLGPVAIAFLPMILSTILFAPALWHQGRKLGRPLQWRWSDARHFIVAGCFGFFFVHLTYTLGVQRTLAANAAVIVLTIPVLVAVAASLMLGEKLNPVRVFGFLVALAGVLVTSVSDLRAASFGNGRYFAGNLLFLGACAGSGFYNTYCKLLIEKKYTGLEILVYTSVVASGCSIPLFLWIEPLDLAAIWHNRGALWGVLELALVVYGCPRLLFFSILKRLDVTQATLSSYALPFFIGLLAVVVLHESFSPLMIFGGAVVFLSTLIVTVYEGGILAWLARRRTAADS
jgi:drug/metabolite transporter (DMT)-like permease